MNKTLSLIIFFSSFVQATSPYEKYNLKLTYSNSKQVEIYHFTPSKKGLEHTYHFNNLVKKSILSRQKAIEIKQILEVFFEKTPKKTKKNCVNSIQIEYEYRNKKYAHSSCISIMGSDSNSLFYREFRRAYFHPTM